MKKMKHGKLETLLVILLLSLLTACGGNVPENTESGGESQELWETVRLAASAFQTDAPGSAELFAENATLSAERTAQGARIEATWDNDKALVYIAVYDGDGRLIGAAGAPGGEKAYSGEISCDAEDAEIVKLFLVSDDFKPLALATFSLAEEIREIVPIPENYRSPSSHPGSVVRLDYRTATENSVFVK